MKPMSNPSTWFLMGLTAAAADAGALWALVATHAQPALWLVICLLALALLAVFCFGAVEDLLWARRSASEDPPEFGPARYTGPERRKGSRRPPGRPVLVVNHDGPEPPGQSTQGG